MAGPSRTISTSAFTCVICCEEGEFFCVGACDHPICFLCSTRIRVLCETKDCPICRRELNEVFLLKLPQHYQAIDHRKFIWNDPVGKKFGYKFEDEEALDVFYEAQSHDCPVCEPKLEFNTFRQLKDHVARQHELFYCEICLEHLKLFSWERKLYTRKELASHKRVGDANDTSHKGHPLCQFCDTRYLDNDLLYRHLRTDHYFCHLCDADGHNRFYDDYPQLRDHFKADHFLCEEGRCKDEQFTGVFRSELDFKGHKSSVHGRDMQRSQLKQERVLNDQLLVRYEQYVPPGQSTRGDGRRGGYGGRDSGEYSAGNSRNSRGNFRGSGRGQGQRDDEADPELRAAMDASMRDPRRQFERPEFSVQSTEFPSLDGRMTESVAPAVGISRRPRWGHRDAYRSGELDNREFPSLRDGPRPVGQSGDVRQRNNESANSTNFRTAEPPAPSVQPQKSAGPYRRPAGNRDFVMIDNDDYPSLSGVVPTGNSDRRVGPASANPAAPKPSGVTDHFNPSFFAQPQENHSVVTAAPSRRHENGAATKPKGPTSIKELLKAAELNQAFVPSWGLGPKPVSLSSAASVLQGKSSRANAEFPSLESSKNTKKMPGQREANSSKTGPAANSPWDKSHKPDAKDKQKAEANEAASKAKAAQANSDSFQVIQPKTKTVVVRNVKVTKPEEAEVPPGFESLVQPENASTTATDSVTNGLSAAGTPPGFTPRPVVSSDPPQLHRSTAPCDAQPVERHYIKPVGFSKRNHSLFEKIESLINADQLAEFKVCSGRFRKGETDAISYCNAVVRLFGRDGALLVFPELIALLPDIEKQRALMRVYAEEGYWDMKRRNHEITWTNNKSTAGWSAKRLDMASDPSMAPAFSLLKLEVCTCCGQILARADVNEHTKEHKLVTDFPLLGK